MDYLRNFLKDLVKNLVLAFILGLTACAPKVIMQPILSAAVMPESATFVVVESDVNFNPTESPLGEIKVRDNGFSVNCNYEKVLALAKVRARAQGANCLKIDDHRPPDFGSTCHRISGRYYRLKDASVYEKEIKWTRERRLRRVDFKADPANRPAVAATVYNLESRYEVSLFTGRLELTVENVFMCQRSYFKPQGDTVMILAHEQLHFDISEIFARKFRQAMQQQVTSLSSLPQLHRQLYDQMTEACQRLQDHYDSDTYRSPYVQLPIWTKRVHQSLDSLQSFEQEMVTIHIR